MQVLEGDSASICAILEGAAIARPVPVIFNIENGPGISKISCID